SSGGSFPDSDIIRKHGAHDRTLSAFSSDHRHQPGSADRENALPGLGRLSGGGARFSEHGRHVAGRAEKSAPVGLRQTRRPRGHYRGSPPTSSRDNQHDYGEAG